MSKHYQPTLPTNEKSEKEKLMESFLTDRIAQVIRDLDPFEEKSFELAQSYIPEIMIYLKHFFEGAWHK